MHDSAPVMEEVAALDKNGEERMQLFSLPRAVVEVEVPVEESKVRNVGTAEGLAAAAGSGLVRSVPERVVDS